MKKLLFIFLLLPLLFLNINIKANSNNVGIVSTKGSSLNIRQEASTSAKIVYKVPNKSYISLISKQNDWYKVEYNTNTYGYAHKNYIKEITANKTTIKTNGGNLNVRTAPNGTIITSLKNKTEVYELSRDGNWSKILYNGSNTGYINNSYLARTEKILSLNNYKQFDTRWESLKVGQSGKTMRQIGCAITSLAITESYRQNKTITPDVMLKQLYFTNSGALYWPSNYKSYTGSSYLNKIYELINEGRPVIVGAKNASGTSHFIVVKGYTNSSKQKSSFKICDPGSSTRVTLEQFFNSYPNFYKLMYY